MVTEDTSWHLSRRSEDAKTFCDPIRRPDSQRPWSSTRASRKNRAESLFPRQNPGYYPLKLLFESWAGLGCRICPSTLRLLLSQKGCCAEKGRSFVQTRLDENQKNGTFLQARNSLCLQPA